MLCKKCDRCGTVYENEDKACERIYRIITPGYPYDDSFVDLCDDCYQKLYEFLKGE